MTDQESPSGSEKLSISFPAGTKDELKALVASGAIPSVSAFVSEAVTERLRRDRFDAKIMALRGGQPFPPEAIEWACKTLGATTDQTAEMLARYATRTGQESRAS
jgi:hypothetical protein